MPQPTIRPFGTVSGSNLCAQLIVPAIIRTGSRGGKNRATEQHLETHSSQITACAKSYAPWGSRRRKLCDGVLAAKVSKLKPFSHTSTHTRTPARGKGSLALRHIFVFFMTFPCAPRAVAAAGAGSDNTRFRPLTAKAPPTPYVRVWA